MYIVIVIYAARLDKFMKVKKSHIIFIKKQRTTTAASEAVILAENCEHPLPFKQ